MTIPDYPSQSKGRVAQLRRQAQSYRDKAAQLRESLTGTQQAFHTAYLRADEQSGARDRIRDSARQARRTQQRGVV